MGCKQCKNPVCKEQLALIIHNRPSTANLEFKPMLFDFQGTPFVSDVGDIVMSEMLLAESLRW